ncbi:MAG TPA: glycosyltransferase [Phycisphaerae bacterium]|jgi:GT2 family glycosyltransferase
MQGKSSLRPFVSFVVATFNRGPVVIDCLRRTAETARGALGGGRFSILVVDNGSMDATQKDITNLSATYPEIKLFPLGKNCGPVAKNIALEGNDADIIVLMDDDAYPMPGSLAQMIRHFQDDPSLGAAVFDVTLPDGRKESSAYPDVFIGAGTALRGTALRQLAASRASKRPGKGFLPADFFMQAEEYDLSFRLVDAGWSVQRFWDMPLMHFKTPGARIATRTTRLDVRNNLWTLARYLPEPHCHQLAADWLARYWRMAARRDQEKAAHEPGHGGSHKGAYMRGAGEGLSDWSRQRNAGELILGEAAIERIFKFQSIEKRLAQAVERWGFKRIAWGDWGKNMLAFYKAASAMDLEMVGIVDGNLCGTSGETVEYRGIPVMPEGSLGKGRAEAIVVTAISPVHAQRRVAELRRVSRIPVLDLFGVQTAETPLLSGV